MKENPGDSKALQQARMNNGDHPLPDVFITDVKTGEVIDPLGDESAAAIFATELLKDQEQKEQA